MEPESAFLSETLESGLQVVGQPMAGVESAALGFLVGAGARNERPDQFGVSRFTEQMLFRGTRSLDARQLSEEFDALGINYDSSAGIEMTLLTAVLLSTRLERAAQLLCDVIHSSSFPEDALESVRSQILQERRQREDKPIQRVLELLRRYFFAGSPLSHDVLGSDETVESMSRDQAVEYWSEWYVPNNMLLSIAGNFSWDAFIDQLRAITASWAGGKGRTPIEPPVPQSSIHVLQKETTQEHLGIAFPGVPAASPEYYAAALVAQALGGGTNSRLHQEVREKRGLAYSASARFDGLEVAGLFRVYVGTSSERAHESVEVVMAELHKLERDGISETELDLAKTRLKSSLIMRSESSSARMAANLRTWWFERRLHSLEDVKGRIDAVSIEQIQNLMQELHITDHLTAVALGPRDEAELFGGLLAPTP